MDIFRGDLTDISVYTETLVSGVCAVLRPGGAHVHNNTPHAKLKEEVESDPTFVFVF